LQQFHFVRDDVVVCLSTAESNDFAVKYFGTNFKVYWSYQARQWNLQMFVKQSHQSRSI